MNPATIEQYARNARDCETTGDLDGLAAWLERIAAMFSPEKPCDVCEDPHANCGAGCDGYGN